VVRRDSGARFQLLRDFFMAYGRRGLDGVAVDHQDSLLNAIDTQRFSIFIGSTCVPHVKHVQLFRSRIIKLKAVQRFWWATANGESDLL
jgi:hypothetical protein